MFSVLSHFDPRVGPKIYANYPQVPEDIQVDHISFLMDFYDEGFFIHEFGELKTLNRIFSIQNNLARGKSDILMVSICVIDENINERLVEDILEIFVSEFKHLQRTFIKSQSKTNREFYHTIENFLQAFTNSIPLEQASFKLKVTNLLIFGYPNNEVSPIVQSLRDFFSDVLTSNTILLKRSNLFSNVSLFSYNFLNGNFISKVLSKILEDFDGLIFIFKPSQDNDYIEVNKLIFNISEYLNENNIPIAIIYENQYIQMRTQYTCNNIEVDSVNNNNCKVFPSDIIGIYDFTEIIDWLSGKITRNQKCE